MRVIKGSNQIRVSDLVYDHIRKNAGFRETADEVLTRLLKLKKGKNIGSKTAVLRGRKKSTRQRNP